MVEQTPETQVPEAETREDSDLEGLYSPLPDGQEEMSNVLGAVAEKDEELHYSSDSQKDGEIEEDESGAQGHWSR